MFVPVDGRMLTFYKLRFNNMKKTLIPEDNSVESIKSRERIIREFYREWKEKNPALIQKGTLADASVFAPTAWRWFTFSCDAMRAGTWHTPYTSACHDLCSGRKVTNNYSKSQTLGIFFI